MQAQPQQRRLVGCRLRLDTETYGSSCIPGVYHLAADVPTLSGLDTNSGFDRDGVLQHHEAYLEHEET